MALLQPKAGTHPGHHALVSFPVPLAFTCFSLSDTVANWTTRLSSAPMLLTSWPAWL